MDSKTLKELVNKDTKKEKPQFQYGTFTPQSDGDTSLEEVASKLPKNLAFKMSEIKIRI